MPGVPFARGILTISPADFLVQMRTMRALRAPTIARGLEAQAAGVWKVLLDPAATAPAVIFNLRHAAENLG